MEPDQTPGVGLERGGDSVHRDLDVQPTLTELDSGTQSSPQRTILKDMDLTKFEVGLLFKVELVDIPSAVHQLMTVDTRSVSLLPVVRVVFHDNHSTGLTLGNEFLPASSVSITESRRCHPLVRFVKDGYNPAFSDSHSQVPISHRKGIVASLRHCRIS